MNGAYPFSKREMTTLWLPLLRWTEDVCNDSNVAIVIEVRMVTALVIFVSLGNEIDHVSVAVEHYFPR